MIPGLASFSIFCGISVLVLYFSVLTLFLPMVYWDTLRVNKRYGDCFGLFFCAEDSIFFLKGRLLSKPQREFSLKVKKENKASEPRKMTAASSSTSPPKELSQSKEISQTPHEQHLPRL